MKHIIQVITDNKFFERVKKEAKKDMRSVSSYCLIAIRKEVERGNK